MSHKKTEVSKGLEELGTVIKKCSGGYGFIRRDLHPKKHSNAFFHASHVKAFNKLAVGDRVRFTLSQVSKAERKRLGQKNPSAVCVCKVV
jgi:cold shock CspA family protein